VVGGHGVELELDVGLELGVQLVPARLEIRLLALGVLAGVRGLGRQILLGSGRLGDRLVVHRAHGRIRVGLDRGLLALEAGLDLLGARLRRRVHGTHRGGGPPDDPRTGGRGDLGDLGRVHAHPVGRLRGEIVEAFLRGVEDRAGIPGGAGGWGGR